MKTALCQINPLIGDLRGNKEKILKYYKRAQEDCCDIAVFPELALCGYPPMDLVEKREFREMNNKLSLEIASETGTTAIIFGAITDNTDSVGPDVHNSAIMAFDGKIQFIQDKSLLPNYDVFDENRYFDPAADTLLFEFKGKKLGISICEDIWNDADYWNRRRYVYDPVKKQIELGAEIIINISASPYSYGKRTQRKDMLSKISSKAGIPLIYTCTSGVQTDLIFDGGSMCFDGKGNLCLLAETYSEDFIVFDTEEKYSAIGKAEREFAEEIHDALVYGIKEYCSKTGFKKILAGLSGGIDSALVVYLASKAIGSENVHAVMMPSVYSSEGSIADSLKLIDNLGISSEKIPIQPVFEKCLEVLTPHFAGKPPDVTEENLQARIRGLYLMALSNKFGSLLCTTGNKSEMAVGYATLYGDMNGALAVIADLYKTQVYELCRFINKDKEIIPDEILVKPPSAELRPGQKDQDSLPPYEILDEILKYYLEENKEINEIAELMDDRELVERVLRMVDRNEFKRKQAAPALRVSKKAFGSGRRFPIVQGWRK